MKKETKTLQEAADEVRQQFILMMKAIYNIGFDTYIKILFLILIYVIIKSL